MSIGPSSEDQPKDTPVVRTRLVPVDVVKKFFARPAYILFYSGMAALLIALFFNIHIALGFYGALAVCGFLSLCQWAVEQKEAHKDKPHGIS